jgi:RNA polymerase sigma-70 factor (ECF subfamily)
MEGSVDTRSGRMSEGNIVSLSARASSKTAHGRPASGPGISAPRQMAAEEIRSAQSFKAVVMPYLDDAYTLARYLTRNQQDADDIVQDAYLRAFKFFATFRGDNPRAWLLAIVRNCFFTWVKAKPRGQEQSLSDLDTFDNADADVWACGPADPETAMVRIDDAAVVRKLIEGLPMPFREVLVLRELDDLSYREIGEVTGVPTGTVMSRLARARMMFKAAWMDLQAKEKA